jgi:hypothetical protein
MILWYKCGKVKQAASFQFSMHQSYSRELSKKKLVGVDHKWLWITQLRFCHWIRLISQIVIWKDRLLITAVIHWEFGIHTSVFTYAPDCVMCSKAASEFIGKSIGRFRGSLLKLFENNAAIINLNDRKEKSRHNNRSIFEKPTEPKVKSYYFSLCL